MNKQYFVYMLASLSRALYTGVTSELSVRIWEHRNGIKSTFASKYRIDRLVHFEVYNDVRAAIAREKEIKGWRREKKMKLIEANNPDWRDLAIDWNIEKLQATQPIQ